MKDLIIDALATYRVTKFVLDDELPAEAREAAFAHLDAHPGKVSKKIEYFLTCPWCVSIWAGAGLTILRAVSPKAAAIVNTTLAASAVTGLMYSRL